MTTRARGLMRIVREAMSACAGAHRYVAGGVTVALVAFGAPLPVGVSAEATSSVIISEIHPAGSGNGTYSADWFEVTNIGDSPVDVTGWRVDDDSNSFASSLLLNGVGAIAPGESVVFLETSNLSATGAAFLNAWFGTDPPAGLQIGSYSGSGVGLGTGGDQVNLFDAGGNKVAGVSFGAATAASTFDNTAGLPAVTTLSAIGSKGAFLSSNSAEVGSPGLRVVPPVHSTALDLSTYVRVGRFDLPEPTRTVAPPNSVLAQEVSAVTYNWDTDTLFVVGDGGTSVVQVTKTGALIDSMTLAPGGSPQGTDFYDPEGLAYVGGGKFVMVEERDRQAVLFTYAAGTTLTRQDARTVKLGTFIGNIGIEGVAYDPLTGGFIAVKETAPQGIFHTGIDFDEGTATNGSPTAENSIDLFDPALLGLLDLADVFALSDLPGLNESDASHLLVLSQESGRILHVDRQGHIYNALTIRPDPGNPLSVAAQQHEGLTMDADGYLYVVSENGGGDFDHPQLWVYAPSHVPNQAPTGVVLSDTVEELEENTSTAVRIKVADVLVLDDELGANDLAVTGPDAGFFEIDDTGLHLKAGTPLDFQTKASYTVTVTVDDPTVGGSPDATAPYTLIILDAGGGPSPVSSFLVVSEVAPWSSGNSPVGTDWFEVTNIGPLAVDITGWMMDDNSESLAAAVPLSGVTSIGPGESVIFIETTNLASARATFLQTWFGANPPAGLQIGSYTGGAVSLSTGGDAVVLYDGNGVLQARVSFGVSAAGPFATFDNSAGLNNAALLPLSAVGVHGAFVAVNGANEGELGSPGVGGKLVVTEVAPWASGNSPVGADWFEVTNVGAIAVNVTGWKVDDSSESPAAAVPLSGISSIAPGESVIFIETDNLASVGPVFLQTWFGDTPPAGLQIGGYSGSGIGLSTGGDAVVLYDAGSVLRAKVFFGASPQGPSFPTFDNAAGLNDAAMSQLSVAGVHSAFVAANSADEIGSPGGVGKLVITEVAPWSSSNSPVGADWFEVTNTSERPVNVVGWRVDDDSRAFASAVPLSGITSIGPGESVIFIETAGLASARGAFLQTWFGPNPPPGLQIGGYSGSGIGLSTGGDAVALYDSTGALRASVSFGASPQGPSFQTFDNAHGQDGITMAQVSTVGLHGTFVAVGNANEVGSPGAVAQAPTVIRGGYGYNRATGRFSQQVTLRNDGVDPMVGPIVLVLDNLTNASLVNQTGTTTTRAPLGSPYIIVAGAGETLGPGATRTVILQFANPTLGPIDYYARPLVLTGNDTP